MKKILLSIFFLPAFLPAAASTAGPYFHILEKTENSVVVEWTAPDLHWATVQAGAESYMLPALGVLPLAQNPGAPQLPVDALTFEQRGALLTVTVLDSVFEMAAGKNICPTASIDSRDSDGAVFYERDESIYRSNRFYPASFVNANEGAVRDRRFACLQINPLKFNPGTGEVMVLRYLKVEIRSTGEGVGDGHHPFYKKTLVDEKLTAAAAFSLGKKGQPALQKPASPLAALSGVKIYLVDEGVYAVSGDDLGKLGLFPGSMNPQNIKILNRGVEVPCYVSGADDGVFNATDRVLFFAERLAGDAEFYHAYTDTNIYWLTWDNTPGKRPALMTSETAAEFRYSFPHTQHFEQDLDYYQGDTNADIQDSRDMPGETWVWDKAIDPGEKFRTTFALPGYLLSQANAVLKLRVRGQTYDSQPNAHHIRISLNSNLVLDTFFDDREELLPTITLDGSLLRAADNTLEIESVSQGGRVSRFYFDWFEVSYEKSLTATNGWLRIDSLATIETGLWVNGFTSPEVSLWDVQNNRQITPQNIGTSWATELAAKSAGLADGNFASFFIGSQMVYSGTRGISVVVLDPADGRVLLKKTFDTYGAQIYSDSLAAMLNSLATGAIVLAGARDDGANNLTAAAITAFQGCGSQKIAGLKYRDSWAFIGRKGDKSPLAEELKTSGAGSASAVYFQAFAGGDSTYNVRFKPAANGLYVLFEPVGIQSPLKIKWRENNPLAALGGADYILITHAQFLEQAQRLADYRRQTNGLVPAVVNLEDIYDAFSFGIADAEAIRAFMHSAWSTWQPAPAYLLLFGDASWDSKQRLAGTAFSNFVPSLGNPVSDVLFACFDGPDDFLPDVSVGRIPVKSREEAAAAVDKIIEYESMPSARWKKQVLFISGGLDNTEQELFSKQSNSLAADFVATAPTFGAPVYIAKNDPNAQADPRSLIIDAFDSGLLWVNFIGHAASRTWELMFNNPDIDDLSNAGFYPFISSMTCHTGRFAEPNQESFGERFLLVPDKGAIGFWGTSGWGYSYEDYLYLRQLFPTVLADSVRQMGDIITLTKFKLWQRYGDGAHIRNLILQYNLMGDPALGLGLPKQPDLAIEPQDITVSPTAPSEADSTATISFKVQNWGLATRDSVDVRVDIEQLVTNAGLQESFTLPPLGLLDSLSFAWPLRKMAGPVEITATVDPLDHIREWDETNNRRASQVTVLTSTFAQVAPLNNTVLPVDEVVLKIQTPQQYFDDALRYVFEVDTAASFSSPQLKTSPPIQAHPLLIKWQPDGLLPNQKYYWRAFRQDNPTEPSFLASFYTTSQPGFGWRQADADAATNNLGENAAWSKAGLELKNKAVTLLLQSAWTNSVGYAVIERNNQAAMQTARGYNIVVLDQHNGEIREAGHFDTYGNAQAATEMAQFIANIPSGRIVLAAVSDEGSGGMNEAAYQALESIGSAKIRQLAFRDMWALIGRKGAAPGSVPEGWEPAKANGIVALRDTLNFRQQHGWMLSERIGPAAVWQSLRLDFVVPDSSNFFVDVYGYHKAGGDTVRLLSRVQDNQADISAINAVEFPFIALRANLATSSAVKSPLLQNWQVNYRPAPDITIGRQLFTQSADSVLVGQSATFYFDVYNIGLAEARDIAVVIENANQSGQARLAELKIDSVLVDRYAPISFTWTAGAVPGIKQIAIVADPNNELVELSEANNSILTTIFVHADTLKPDIRVTFDDREIFDGDLVAAQPVIVARLFDNNPELAADTSRLNLLLDGAQIPLADPAVTIQPGTAEPGLLGELVFRPALADGQHQLEIQLEDMSHNTASKKINFAVENDLAVRDALNYPNPFAQDTEFSFVLSKQANIQIKVFTVAGRLIRTIEPGITGVGYNRVYWDGRDEVGDAPANGVYLYKIIAQTAEARSETTGKVIIMR